VHSATGFKIQNTLRISVQSGYVFVYKSPVFYNYNKSPPFPTQCLRMGTFSR